MLDRVYFERLDDEDPLASVGERFSLPEGVVYLDGNSLGPLPAHVPDVVARAVTEEWGMGLIRSWNERGWWTLTREVGERIASLIGADPGTVVAGDTTTIALFKAAVAARRLRQDREVILTDSGNFPTDIYALGSAAEMTAATMIVVPPDEVLGRIERDVAVVSLTHVDFKSGRRHDLDEITGHAHAMGALVLWDLSHTTGAMNVDVSEADMAVGCGYKYLNGGPGAPAFTYVNRRHLDAFHNPIAGWWGHEEPFAMVPGFEPAKGIGRVQVGTQPVISLVSLAAALDVFDGVSPGQLRAKSERLVSDFIRLVDERLEGFEVVTPRRPELRGSHVTLAHPLATGIMAALVADGVIGDVRPPHLLRFGLAPAFQRHVDVWDAVEAIRCVVDEERHLDAPPPRGPVT